MTAARYHSYRRALALVAELEQGGARPQAIQLLRQSAEDLLLAREFSAAADESLTTAGATLLQLIVVDDTDRPRADRLLEALTGSGPPRPEGNLEPAMSGSIR